MKNKSTLIQIIIIVVLVVVLGVMAFLTHNAMKSQNNFSNVSRGGYSMSESFDEENNNEDATDSTEDETTTEAE